MKSDDTAAVADQIAQHARQDAIIISLQNGIGNVPVLREAFEDVGVEVRASSFTTVAEEIPEAYKDVAEVVGVVHGAGIGRKVARLRPLGVLKG